MERCFGRRCFSPVTGIVPTAQSPRGFRGKPRQLCTTIKASQLRYTKGAQIVTPVQTDDDQSCRLDSNSLATTSGMTQGVPVMSFAARSGILSLQAAYAGVCLLPAGSVTATELSNAESWLPIHSMHDTAFLAPEEAAELADLLQFPSSSQSPFQVLTYLLQHPLITLGVAAALYFLVPRIFRAFVRFLVLPVALALVIYVVSLNPSAATGFAQGSFNFLSSHPVEVSAAIIVALAFALSPYILILGVALLLVTGVPKLPPFLRPVLPGPLVQAQQQASELQQAVLRPLAALRQSLSEATGGVQRSFDDVWTRGTAPARQVAKEYWDASQGAQRAVAGVGEGALYPKKQVMGSVGGMASSLEERRLSMQQAADEAMRCRSEATPLARAACMERQNRVES